MILHGQRRSASRMLAALTISTVAGGALVAAVPASAAVTTTTKKSVTVAPSDDAYVQSDLRTRNTGALDKVVAGVVPGVTKTALYKFKTPVAPAGATLTGARLELTSDRNLPPRVDLRRVSTTSWAEETVTHAVGPALTSTLRSVAVQAATKTVAFDMRQVITPGTWQAFGVTVPAGTAAFHSKEAALGVPRLVLEYTLPSSAPTPVPAPAPASTVRIGMSSPQDQWDARLAQTGGVDSRRIFDDLATPDFGIRMATSEAAAGRMAILSFKIPGNDWAGVGRGTYDAQLKSLAAQLGAVRGRVFVTLHHEPAKDGTAVDYAAMMRRALPILGASANVDAGPIVNGWFWSSRADGLSDLEIAQWLPADVLRASEVVAADTYQGGTVSQPGENAAVKITRMSAWADRVGVTRLGLGEYNGLDAASVTAAGDAIMSDRRFVFAAIFNSSVNNPSGVDWTLTGDRLTAFQATVAKSRAGRS